ncbi:MAG: Efflux transporter, family, subunit [Pedosphaera sp.]|nr:Efflux transporter, family, subunit [Pedosphaera sp.]
MKLRHLFTLTPLLVAIYLLVPACSHDAERGVQKNSGVAYYTCSMHPSVRSQDPNAKCPICSMDLTPVMKQMTNSETNPASLDHAPDSAVTEDTNRVGQPTEFTVPVARQQMIGVTYATVQKKALQSTLRTVGTVAYDKQRHWDYVSRLDGYIQKLEVASRGDVVEKDQPLLTIYSPDLLTTQREFLNLLQMRDEAQKAHSEAALKSAESLIESARRRLFLWNITTNQIEQLEQSREARDTLTLYSPFKGVVQNLQVDQGRRVSMGDHLVDIADLSMVWVWAQFYQDELPLLKTGAAVSITSDSYPDQKINGKIALVDPFVNEGTRTVRVRIDVENHDFKLRPDMYVNVFLESDRGEGLTVPVNAVLPTGERNIVFVDKGEGRLEPRFVEVGRKYGDDYEIKSGLKEGERVVNSANFLIDAESQVQGALKSW